MLLKELKEFTRKSINGSITNYISRNVRITDNFKDSFNDWYGIKFYKDDNGKEFVYFPFADDESFEVDRELLKELKTIFKERFNKRIIKLKEQEESIPERQKGEPPTDKQLRYAKRLFFKLHGIKNNFDDREYSKKEMVDIIQDLNSRLDEF